MAGPDLLGELCLAVEKETGKKIGTSMTLMEQRPWPAKSRGSGRRIRIRIIPAPPPSSTR